MTLICNTPATIQTTAEPMIEQQISLLDRALLGKLIPITHASQKETLRSESVRKEIPTYTDSIYRPPPKPPNLQNTNEEKVCVLEKESLHYMESDYRPLQNPLTYLNCQGYY